MSARAALAALALLAALACAAEPASEARVVRVKDGDSFSALLDGERVEVRIFGIDAPERGQPWSRRAKQALEERIASGPVALTLVEWDAYGRMVAWVDAAGVCVGCEQVRDGHAWVYRRYTDDRELLALEDAARAAGRGLWGLPEPERVAPWAWRSRSRR